MDENNHTAAIIIFGLAIAAIIGFAIYVAWDKQATHDRWVDRLSGTSMSITEPR